MHDAIVLANRINGLPFHPIAEEIEAMFKEYQEERIDWVNQGFESSKVFKSMTGQVIKSMLHRMPDPNGNCNTYLTCVLNFFSN